LKKAYLRDNRSPVPLNENVSRVMSRNKARNTKPELNLRRSLYADGVRGYRLNWKKAPGTPDIAFPGKKIAIFINGCYWHRCPHCELPLPKTNKEFWEEKFDKNIKRDIKKEKELLDLGWIVLVFWECKIKTNMKDCTNKIKAILECH
jgi:DNA mismatch endonuclease (patch repair protein)|tara:strand:- start:1389 stop:1832 length:444 start_codon:yes stop_codon:yes gene_type:complete